MKSLASISLLPRILGILSLFGFLSLTVISCVDEDEFPDTPQGNFKALWKVIDEHYCFFDYKQHAYGLDWQQIYNKCNVRAKENITDYQLFEVLADMLAELVFFVLHGAGIGIYVDGGGNGYLPLARYRHFVGGVLVGARTEGTSKESGASRHQQVARQLVKSICFHNIFFNV